MSPMIVSNFFLFLITIFSFHGLEKKSIQQTQKVEKISFWDAQQKGANYFNKTPTREWFESAAKANIRLVRFTYEKWEGEQRDFLLGSADDYAGIVEKDFQKLKHYLDVANQLDMKVVISPLSLPGARYAQSNGRIRDGRLWTDQRYLSQAIQFWKDLATRLKDQPNVVGYNLINEPHPEWFHNKRTFWDKGFQRWYQDRIGKPGDLNSFNQQLIKAIRTIDKKTPIIVASGLYATPWAFEYLKPVDDPHIIYSFHMYEPYSFTTRRINDGKYQYPGKIPIADLDGEIFTMNKESLHEFLNPVKDWAEKNKIPSNRIWAAEFGCDRKTKGAENYLNDLIDIFNEENWHWSFYAYREDVWESMDYELGTQNVYWKYWDYSDAGILHENYDEIYARTNNNSLWSRFKNELSTSPTSD
ncbi:MAG: cellulase family glycosylhydrolase [Flavobacteriaceae bacterium]|nr:cellulase family glycosylhydrolase [Flavobacteriaceae bacterium]MCY4254495.1 cellulase family glycosylhydrolase [Flavobacteriaceae bacterium]